MVKDGDRASEAGFCIMTEGISVDIIMGAYNGAKFLNALIESLRSQTHRKWRLLVRDDDSQDDTVALLNAAAQMDSRVQVVTDNLGNLGCERNFHHLLGVSTAPYVMYCDPDDVWLPEKN